LDWLLETFGAMDIVRTKPALWKRMSDRMRSGGAHWHGLEFGVAFGHATDWWLSHHDRSVLSTWDGFDRFTGLPRAWRAFPEGAFDAGGRTPAIDDSRVAWHVGDVENTIADLDVERIASGQRLIYFDLDVYEPSKVAWDWLLPYLKPGDLLYFDEAFDHDERRLITESVLPAGSFDLIGATDNNLAIEIRSLDR
jgi:hypothetical protein